MSAKKKGKLGNYYEQLITAVAHSMEANPKAVIAMDARTFKVLSADQNATRLAKRVKGFSNSCTVVFQKPNPNQVMVL